MQGIHHIGLAVSNLTGSCSFFCDLLGWSQVRKVEEYPAIFVSNGNIMFTLWQTDKDPISFDRKKNVGLHHVALQVDSEDELMKLHQTLEASDSVHIEFSPELLRDGPALHMMCIEPSGIRVEFIWLPQ
jgi:catechol 2,3-dioxygenase-like lactoylglutathione lyase family enzyme